MMISRARHRRGDARWIGTPYRHQASLKGVGCDCLGLVRGVWRAVIGEEPEPAPPYAPDWAEATAEESLAGRPRGISSRSPSAHFAPGDVLLFRWRANLAAKHAAIVTAPTLMVHAHDGAAVARSRLRRGGDGAWLVLFSFPE